MRSLSCNRPRELAERYKSSIPMVEAHRVYNQPLVTSKAPSCAFFESSTDGRTDYCTRLSFAPLDGRVGLLPSRYLDLLAASAFACAGPSFRLALPLDAATGSTFGFDHLGLWSAAQRAGWYDCARRRS